MERDRKNYNDIFSYAFIGSLLFVAALAYTLANLTNIAMLEISYTGIATVLAISSISLLYKAAKNDKNRLSGL